MKNYWNSFHPADREILCDEVNIRLALAGLEFEHLPWYIRYMLYAYYNRVWRNQKHELKP